MDKHKLINLAKELLLEENLDKRSEDLIFIKRQYKFLSEKDEETYYERMLTEEFNALYEQLAKKAPKLNQSVYDEKKEIIELVKKLSERKDIVKASHDLDNLTIAFKKAGRSSKEQDDALYEEFKNARNEFLNKKRAYFEELDKSNSEKRKQKEEIIEKAKKLFDIKNIKESNDKMNALMEEWKAVGYAGKQDNELWNTFSEVRREFNQKKRERHSELKKMFVERANKKEELIKEMKLLLANSDFSSEEVKRVKNLRRAFNEVGFVGKEKEEELNNKFDEIVKQYFEDKKFYTF